jgi:DinB superfamily
MQERTRAFTEEFDEVAGEFIAEVESLSAERWRATCPDEGWSVGVSAHHVADWWPVIAGIVQTMADRGTVTPMAIADVHERNANHAARQVDCDKEETLALLRERGAAVSTLLRSLEDSQLDRSAAPWGREVSSELLIVRNLIGHPRHHLAAIRAAV